MDLHILFANVAAIAVTMTCLAALEAAVPLFVRPAGRRPIGVVNVQLMLVNVVANGLLLAGTAFLVRVDEGGSAGVVDPLGRASGARIVLGVLVIDFAYGYLAHRLMHGLPFLWRVHRVHHSDPFVDVTTSYRNHPLESAWRQVFIVVPAALFGLPPEALALHRVLSIVNAALEHANVRLWRPLDRALAWLWVTPDMHKLHHSRDRRETDSNYGNLCALFDRALGTHTPSARAADVRYGLDDAPEADAVTLSVLLVAPFVSRRDDAVAPEVRSAPAPRP